MRMVRQKIDSGTGGNSKFEIRISAITLLTILSLVTTPAFCAEITSNGSGGGNWSDPSTWHGGKVPTGEDSAVIAREDAVAFDRDDDTGVTCKQLYLDPKSVLTFKNNAKRTMVVAGPIETYGMIRIESSPTNADATLELRLAGPTIPDRAIRLQKGGSLMVKGATGLPGQRRNITLSSAPLVTDPKAPPVADPSGTIEVITSTSFDMHNANIRDLLIQATSIDNTGAKPDERFNLGGNKLTGMARVVMSYTDTPAITDNAFIWMGPGSNGNPAVQGTYCDMMQITGNTFQGNRERAVYGNECKLGSIEKNSFEGPYYGIVWIGPDAGLRGNTFRDCTVGLNLNGVGAAMEDSVIDGAKTAAIQMPTAGTLQITSCMVTNLAKDAVAVDLGGSSQVDVLNCNITPQKIRVAKTAHNNDKNVPVYWAQGQDYVIVHVKGALPKQTQVDIDTATPTKALPPGAMDLNVRNTPADLFNGWTPLPQPQGLPPLIVRTWCIEGDGHMTPAPDYTLKVLGPAPKAEPNKPEPPQPVLKALAIKPLDSWFRAKPNDLVATVEVSVP